MIGCRLLRLSPTIGYFTQGREAVSVCFNYSVVGGCMDVEHTPTTKNTPAKTATGMVCRTTRSGPVMVPIRPRPMKKWEMRCSTTARGFTIGRRISAPSPSSVLIIERSVS